MTIFSLWHDRMSSNENQTAIGAFTEVINSLERDFGTWRVAWGELNRLQRLDESKDEDFQDSKPSLAVSGVNGNDGAVFTFIQHLSVDKNDATALREERTLASLSLDHACVHSQFTLSGRVVIRRASISWISRRYTHAESSSQRGLRLRRFVGTSKLLIIPGKRSIEKFGVGGVAFRFYLI
jgi:hypothetical protein